MRKIKICSLLTVALLLGMSASMICGAEEPDNILAAEVNVTVEDWIGQVKPDFNVTTANENDSVELKCIVNVTDPNPANHTYDVNDTLIINMNIDDQSSRVLGFFIMPRCVRWKAYFSEDSNPYKALFKNTYKANGRALVADSLLNFLVPPGEVDDKIVIDMSGYDIDKDTFENGEEIYLHVYMKGFIPGHVNGGLLDGLIPILDQETIKLTLSFEAE